MVKQVLPAKVNRDVLRSQIQEKYAEVAKEPEKNLSHRLLDVFRASGLWPFPGSRARPCMSGTRLSVPQEAVCSAQFHWALAQPQGAWPPRHSLSRL